MFNNKSGSSGLGPPQQMHPSFQPQQRNTHNMPNNQDDMATNPGQRQPMQHHQINPHQNQDQMRQNPNNARNYPSGVVSHQQQQQQQPSQQQYAAPNKPSNVYENNATTTGKPPASNQPQFNMNQQAPNQASSAQQQYYQSSNQTQQPSHHTPGHQQQPQQQTAPPASAQQPQVQVQQQQQSQQPPPDTRAWMEHQRSQTEELQQHFFSHKDAIERITRRIYDGLYKLIRIKFGLAAGYSSEALQGKYQGLLSEKLQELQRVAAKQAQGNSNVTPSGGNGGIPLTQQNSFQNPSMCRPGGGPPLEDEFDHTQQQHEAFISSIFPQQKWSNNNKYTNIGGQQTSGNGGVSKQVNPSYEAGVSGQPTRQGEYQHNRQPQQHSMNGGNNAQQPYPQQPNNSNLIGNQAHDPYSQQQPQVTSNPMSNVQLSEQDTLRLQQQIENEMQKRDLALETSLVSSLVQLEAHKQSLLQVISKMREQALASERRQKKFVELLLAHENQPQSSEQQKKTDDGNDEAPIDNLALFAQPQPQMYHQHDDGLPQERQPRQGSFFSQAPARAYGGGGGISAGRRDQQQLSSSHTGAPKALDMAGASQSDYPAQQQMVHRGNQPAVNGGYAGQQPHQNGYQTATAQNNWLNWPEFK